MSFNNFQIVVAYEDTKTIAVFSSGEFVFKFVTGKKQIHFVDTFITMAIFNGLLRADENG